MIIEFKDRTAPKNPGKWYSFNYDNGLRVSFSDFQGDLTELEDMGRKLSREKKREIRMRVHDDNGLDRIHAIFRYGRRVFLNTNF